MSDYKAIVESYLLALDNSDLQGILALFEDDATVISPFLGTLAPRIFFPKVIENSAATEITVFDICVSARDKARAIGYFNYDWTLNDGTHVLFDCCDVFEFSGVQKINSMIIMYDTYPIRELVGDKYT